MVTYRLDLISGDLARRFFRTGPAPVRGVACVPELTR